MRAFQPLAVFLVTGASKCAGKRTSAVSSARSYICIATAGAVYGLLVHWRVFPVVYGPSLILFFWNTSRKVCHVSPVMLGCSSVSHSFWANQRSELETLLQLVKKESV